MKANDTECLDEHRVDDILTAHADSLIGRPQPLQQVHVTQEEQEELAPLFELAEHLHRYLEPVHPSSAFVHSLGKELTQAAKHQIAASKRVRRGVLIGAATVGSLVSVASLVGAIILIVHRLRDRSHAHAHTS